MNSLWGGAVQGIYPEALPADYYLCKTIATPVITDPVSVGDEVINVNDTTLVVAGHAITMYEGHTMFQTLVTAKTAGTISLAAPVDYGYTAAALVETGLWSMNIDGSTTPQIFSIKSPPDADICVHSINCSMLDSSDMDDGRFGGMVALTNGVLFRFVNGIEKNLAVVVNNLGFWEIGFQTEYSAKAPAGQYGFRAQRTIPVINGVVLNLEAGGIAEFQVHVRDALGALDLFACVLHGHMVDKR